MIKITMVRAEAVFFWTYIGKQNPSEIDQFEKWVFSQPFNRLYLFSEAELEEISLGKNE